MISGTQFHPVYPRWRGEHHTKKHAVINLSGLSPLARGTLYMRKIVLSLLRFIPAGAGKTYPEERRVEKSAVYPRWRGEHFVESAASSDCCGLSPLARGTPIGGQSGRHWSRFIPAGAGNTIVWFLLVPALPVYPRWRGEHSYKTVFLVQRRGLSPLARGTHTLVNGFTVGIRFIPAGAGNTLTACGVNGCLTVYPRWRGEHDLQRTPDASKAGLSPLARGTRIGRAHLKSK